MNYIERDLYETGLRKMFHDWRFKPNHFLTLTFRNPPLSEKSKHQRLAGIDQKRALDALRNFVAKLNSSLYGRRSKKAVKLASFIEGNNIKHRHFHILITVPDEYLGNRLEEFKSLVVKIWLKSEPMSGNPCVDGKGDDWFKEIPKNEDADFVAYSLKELKFGAEPFLPELSNLSGKKIKD